MRRWLASVYDVGLSPSFMRRFNFWAMVLFALLIPPSMLYWAQSVPYLVAISVWANFAGHLSAWQSSRVEERQEVAADDDG